jgi:type VI secretion system (T6SS) phospholipase Tle1-like effector
MPKNIIIFSDGTGQAGGITFDEVRTNVYKLYRACRVGPDTSIDPSEQVAFYDPGLGSPADGSKIKIQWARKIYNLASMATGLGITANIVDCYAALIRLYRDGDRIFLIGFSRGAYTVRSLSGVISLCGIPRSLPNNGLLPMDEKGSRALAETAVKDVYQFCSSYRRGESPYKDFLLDTREAIAKKFRVDHGSSAGVGSDEKANAFPYFIGAFDTVAALGHKGLFWLVVALVLASPFIPSFVISLLSYASNVPHLGVWLATLKFWPVFSVIAPLMVVGAGLIALKAYLKWAPPLPGCNFWRRLKTVHFAELKQRFYDTTLNVNVGYAKHAISIDENRKDFARVGWTPTAAKQNQRDAAGNLFFEQVWFPGVHADVGGGYEENESRLSDDTLGWMLAAASIIPGGLTHDETVLRLHPDPSGPQHNEQKGSLLALGQRKLPSTEAIMHKSVYRRYEAGDVVLFDRIGAYRPVNMNKHVDFIQYYDPAIPHPIPANPPQCLADDIEDKWAKLKAANSGPPNP